MKVKRHNKILEIIENYNIETQEELIEKLKLAGFEVTQATVSRDIRELKLLKQMSDMAQNIAEDLYAAEDPDAVLKSYGFAAEDGGWVLEQDGYLLKVTLQEEATETGELRAYEIAGVKDGETLLTLPSTRFIPKEVSP